MLNEAHFYSTYKLYITITKSSPFEKRCSDCTFKLKRTST